MSECIPDDEWETVIRNVPIVSVDLVVECRNGVVLGKRSNEPAKGEWFVPGGRIVKGERLVEAVHRIANEELGVGVEICESLGAFEHFYDTSDVGHAKQYIAHGFHVWTDQVEFQTDDQHEKIKTFKSTPMDVHEYVREYFEQCSCFQLAPE